MKPNVNKKTVKCYLIEEESYYSFKDYIFKTKQVNYSEGFIKFIRKYVTMTLHGLRATNSMLLVLSIRLYVKGLNLKIRMKPQGR